MTFPFFEPGFLNYPPYIERKGHGCENMGGGGRVVERFCADPVPRSVNHPPPSRGRGQLVSWSAGAIGAEPGPLGGSRRGVKTCCKCLNCCHNKQLWQQLPPFLVVTATVAHAALVQPDERRREVEPLPVLWSSVPVVVAVLRWSAAAPLTVPGLAWSVVAVVADPMQSAGTDRRGRLLHPFPLFPCPLLPVLRDCSALFFIWVKRPRFSGGTF